MTSLSNSNSNSMKGDYSSKIFKHLFHGFKLSYWLAMSSYKYNSWTRMVYSKDGRLRGILCRLQFLLYNAYMTRIAYLWLGTVTTEKDTSPKRIMMQYMFWAFSTPWTVQWNNFVFYGQHQHLLNGAIRLYGEMQVGHEVHTTKFGNKNPARGFTRFLFIVKAVSVCVVLLNVMVVLRKPSLPHLLTTFVPQKALKMSRLFLLVPTILQTFISSTQWVAMYAHMGQISAYLFISTQYLKTLKPRIRYARLTEDDLTEKEFCTKYRKLQLLQTYFDFLHSHHLIYLEVVLLVTVILGILAGVRLTGPQGLRPVLTSSGALATLVFVWVKMAVVHETADRLLHEWNGRRVNRQDWFSKHLKGTRPIGVKLGGFFEADRGLVLTMLDIIVNNTATLLLAK